MVEIVPHVMALTGDKLISVDIEHPLASETVTVYACAPNPVNEPVEFVVPAGASVYERPPLPPVAETSIDPFVLPLQIGFATCVLVHTNPFGMVIVAVWEVSQPALLVKVIVYVFAPRLVNVNGEVLLIIAPGLIDKVIGKLALPNAVILPLLTPLQRIFVCVNDKVGVGSTVMVNVESTLGQPGYEDVIVYKVLILGDAITFIPVFIFNDEEGDQLKVKSGLVGVGVMLNGIEVPSHIVSLIGFMNAGYSKIFMVNVSVTALLHKLPLIAKINVSAPSIIPSCKAVTTMVAFVPNAGIVVLPLNMFTSTPFVALPDNE